MQEQELVLVIRGDLLKKYPTAAIYAHAADWDRGEDGAPHPERERVLAAFPDSSTRRRTRCGCRSTRRRSSRTSRCSAST
ncbi:hypothetical protein O1M54_02830 [Streptomyces diastatochromogenes]|nr:hypothetical protein [Streptomyces diastatochromogenes]